MPHMKTAAAPRQTTIMRWIVTHDHEIDFCMKHISKKYTSLQLALFVFTLLVIIWGAWVRISHSGDGCGQSWPLCAGEFIPSASAKKTWIEYSHRLMSGSYGLWVIGLFLYTRAKVASAQLRQLTCLLLILMIIEALLGAKLVLFKLVGTDDSGLRLIAMALHQINSLLLSGTTFLIYLFSRQQLNQPTTLLTPPWTATLRPTEPQWKYLFFGLLLVAMVGSWASLSNTLHPSSDLWTGFAKDFADDSHYLVKLRFLHPLIASLFSISIVFWKMNSYLDKARAQDLLLALGFTGAFLFGWATLLFLAPVWMKLVHLTFAHCLWALIISSIFDWSSQGAPKTQSAH